MANTIITPSVIAKEALMQLENNLVMGNLVHRDFKKEFVKVGSTVSIRKPVKFVASSGATRVNQDVSESTTSIVIDKQKHVSWGFSSQELTLSVEEYSARYIKPAMIALANAVDSDLCGLYVDVPNAVGTAATTPSTFATSVQLVGTRMDELAMPRDSRVLVVDPDCYWTMAAGIVGQNGTTNLGVFNPGLVEGAFKKAKLGTIGGFEFYMDQNIKSHTKGTFSVGAINGSSQTGTSLTIGTTTGTFVKGDIITMAGCYDVNPVSRNTLSYTKQFVLSAGFSASVTSISVLPSIITSGAYQTASASPTTAQTPTITGTHVANLGFCKQAFALVMVPLEMPDGAPFKARESSNNISVRVIKDYDIDLDQEIIRLDILYGIKTIYPELAVRLLG